MKNPALKISSSIQASPESRPSQESSTDQDASPGQEEAPTVVILCVSNFPSNDTIENYIKTPIEGHFIWLSYEADAT